MKWTLLLVPLLIGCGQPEEVTTPAEEPLLGFEHCEDHGVGIDDSIGPYPPGEPGIDGPAGGGGGGAE